MSPPSAAVGVLSTAVCHNCSASSPVASPIRVAPVALLLLHCDERQPQDTAWRGETQRKTMSSMQAILFYGPDDARLVESPIPTPGPGELLVKVGAALTCG